MLIPRKWRGSWSTRLRWWSQSFEIHLAFTFLLRSQKRHHSKQDTLLIMFWSQSQSFLLCIRLWVKSKNCHSYGQFADEQVNSHHSKNCVNAGQTRSSSVLLTGSGSIILFLFGYIKQKITDQEFLSLNDLLEAIREEFDRLSKSVLENVFNEWLIRLQTCFDYEGSYFPEG
jgi:hypothetical protein